MAKNKLQNIKAVKQLLAGEHRTQTRKSFYFGDAEKVGEKAKPRKVGDRWTEDLGDKVIYWEQMQGYRRRSTTSWDKKEMFDKLRAELNSFTNCPKETCTCKVPNPIDLKFRSKMGMCFECVTKMELEMQINGEFDMYAKKKMFENVKSYKREMEVEMEKEKDDM